jgi:membrane protein
MDDHLRDTGRTMASSEPEGRQRLPRTRRAYTASKTRGTAVYDWGRDWVEARDPASRTGATIGWFKRYRAADGQLYAVLLTAYFFLTIVPLLLVETAYVYKDPLALAHRMEHRLHLSGSTAHLFETVMVGSSTHKFSAVLIAIINLFFFGVGFGRVLQLVHARAWGIDLRKNALLDQSLYYGILVALTLLTFLFVVQTHALRGSAAWIGYVLDVGWLFVLIGFFVWSPWLLLHRRVPARDILPGAVFTLVGFIAARLISQILLHNWLGWYSRTYGALGIVMAIFFWLVILSTIMVLAAALSPALAHRRDLLEMRLRPVD